MTRTHDLHVFNLQNGTYLIEAASPAGAEFVADIPADLRAPGRQVIVPIWAARVLAAHSKVLGLIALEERALAIQD